MNHGRGTASPLFLNNFLHSFRILISHISIGLTQENDDVESIYALDPDTDTGAEARPLSASTSGHTYDNDVPPLHDDNATFSDDNDSLGYMSRSGSPTNVVPPPRSDLNPDGLFDSPGHTPPDSDEDEPLADLEAHPLYQTREALFDAIFDPGPNPIEDDCALSPAFDEDPVIRNAYITAYLLAACHGSTQEAIKSYLDSMQESCAAFQRRTGVEVRGLKNMARTLLTAERRLRIDPNQYIVYYFLCDVCWARHEPTELHELDGPSCKRPDCSGQLYSVKVLTDGQLKRSPLRVLPTAPIKPMIQRFLLRPGKYDEFQHWRIPGIDEVGEVPPLHAPADPLDAYHDPHWVLGDITDGWGWRAVACGLERRKVRSAVSQWGVEDVLVEEKQQRFVSLPCGLLLSINIDW